MKFMAKAGQKTMAMLVLFAGTSAWGVSVVSHQQGGAVSLDSPGGYKWWYGCSATSAGMMMAYYDVNGFSNLVPGGDAESTTFGDGPFRVNDIIASSGHITDFYGGNTPTEGYLNSGDDLAEPWHEFDCLADFMGTSQDAYNNDNGSTQFWNYTDGSRIYDSDLVALGSLYYESSGLYGIREYVEYAGYETGSMFNQYILGYNDNTKGFTFADYVAEIDAGHPMLVHVEGHTMYGYGYDQETSEVLLYDTWTEEGQRMVWGSTYSGMQHYAVTSVEVIPEPAGVVLMAASVVGFIGIRRIFLI